MDLRVTYLNIYKRDTNVNAFLLSINNIFEKIRLIDIGFNKLIKGAFSCLVVKLSSVSGCCPMFAER
jgi:hypothetical protein